MTKLVLVEIRLSEIIDYDVIVFLTSGHLLKNPQPRRNLIPAVVAARRCYIGDEPRKISFLPHLKNLGVGHRILP